LATFALGGHQLRELSAPRHGGIAAPAVAVLGARGTVHGAGRSRQCFSRHISRLYGRIGFACWIAPPQHAMSGPESSGCPQLRGSIFYSTFGRSKEIKSLCRPFAARPAWGPRPLAQRSTCSACRESRTAQSAWRRYSGPCAGSGAALYSKLRLLVMVRELKENGARIAAISSPWRPVR
jgi:hypothetical protein